MNASKTEVILMGALLGTGLVQPVSHFSKGGAVTFLCRQVPGQEKPWIAVVDQLLTAVEPLQAAGTGADIHLCRKYLRREGQLVFGWFLSIVVPKAKELDTVLAAVLPVLQAARPVLTPVTPPVAPQAPQAPTAPAQAASYDEPVEQVRQPEHVPRLRKVVVEDEIDGGTREEIVIPLPHASKGRNMPSKPVWDENEGRFRGGGKGAKRAKDK
jgi:hypothetical protein